MNISQTVKVLPLVLLVGGCAIEETQVERNFGESVRQMISAQTYDQSTIASPSTDTVEGADSQMLEAVLEVYRTDVAAPESVGNEITINVGSGQ